MELDRQTIARNLRRRQVQEALDFEREREGILKEQREQLIGEGGSARVDAEVYSKMSPEHVAIVREHLNPLVYDEGEQAFFGVERDDLVDDAWAPVDAHAEELARLNAELEECRERQQAFAAYLSALEQ